MIHIVNLKHRTDRKEWILKELENQMDQKSIRILEASSPGDISVFDTPNFYDPYNDQFIRSGEMACCLSHMRIYKQISEGDEDFGIILEDDFKMVDNTFQLIDLVDAISKEQSFDILYLSRKALDFNNEQTVGEIKDDESDGENQEVIKIRTANRSYWTLAYAISKECATKIYQKWIDSKHALIPIDEILPLVTGHGIETLKTDFPKYVDNLKALAVYPNIGNPRESLSDTYSSPPMHTVDDPNLLVVSVATKENDMTLRLRDSCRMYNLPLHITGIGSEWNGGDLSAGPGGAHKIIMFREFLTQYEERKDLIIVFVDGYDVVANSSKRTLLNAYRPGQVTFACERACWPDSKLIDDYPPVSNDAPRFLNSGLFIGSARDIMTILKDPEMLSCKPGDDDQLLYTTMFLSKKYNIALDYDREIFQCLSMESENYTKDNNGLIQFNNGKPWFEMKGRRPCFIHGNGGTLDKSIFERFQTYSCLGWSSTYGNYTNNKHANVSNTIYATVMVDREVYTDEYIYRLGHLTRAPDEWVIFALPGFLESAKKLATIIELNYGVNEVEIVTVEEHYQLMEKSFELFQKTKHTYLLHYSSSVIPAADSLAKLEKDLDELTWRSAVAPAIRKGKSYFANFWGHIKSNNYYNRSSDYYHILDGTYKGLFNVPHISEFILMKRRAAQPSYATNYYTKRMGSHFAFCRNLRKNGLTMWVNNSTLFDSNQTWNYHSDLHDTYSTILEQPGQFLAEGGYSTPVLWQKRYLVNDPNTLSFPEVEVKGFKHSNIWYGPLVTPTFCKEIREYANRDESKWKHIENGTVDKRTNGKEHARTHDVHLKDIPFYPQPEDDSKNRNGEFNEKQVGIERCIDYIMDLVIKPWAWRVYKYTLKRARLSFVVKYSMDVQRSLKWHHDASNISLDIALNNAGPGEDEFEGGGVSYDRMDYSMQHGKMGWIALHPGRVTHRHRGNEITRGIREILVCFTE